MQGQASPKAACAHPDGTASSYCMSLRDGLISLAATPDANRAAAHVGTLGPVGLGMPWLARAMAAAHPGGVARCPSAKTKAQTKVRRTQCQAISHPVSFHVANDRCQVLGGVHQHGFE